MLAPRVVPCVERVVNLPRLGDTDIGGQVRVEREGGPLGRYRAPGVEVADLAQCVNSGVGTPGGDHARALPGHSSDGLLDTLLYGHGVILPLPACVARPVVFERQPDVHRSIPPHTLSAITAAASSSAAIPA